MTKEKIRTYFKENKDTIRTKSLALLAELIKVKTVNPGKDNIHEFPYLDVSGDESKAVAVLKKYFDEVGFKYEIYEKIKGRGNIIATCGEGDTSLCVGCHLDVVPDGDPASWDSDPFVMTEKDDGKIYGRGVLDNKGPMVSCIMAMEILKDLGITLNGQLMLSAIASEEYHEKDEPDAGIGFLMEEGHLNPTFAIIPDIGENMKRIDIAEKGRVVIKVTSIGKQAHGSTPERGINAVTKLAHYITNIEKLEMKYTPHPILEKPSLNLGVVRGGQAPNNVPDVAEATFDVRYLPGQTAEEIVEEFKSCAEGITDGKFEFEAQGNVPPHEVAADNILVQKIQSNSEEILGFKPETFGIGGGTFAKSFCLGGIEAVGFGPGDDTAFHVTNEYLEVEQMLQFIELIACISVDLLGAK